MWVLSLLLGIDTESWYARFPLRTRVSMSATGSVMVIAVVSLSQTVSSPGPPRDDLCDGAALGGSLLGGLEREPELAQQRTPLVVVLRRGDDRDVEAADAVDLVLVDLVEHALLRETEGVVAVAVELLRAQAAEVADARERERQEAVQELPGAVAAQG